MDKNWQNSFWFGVVCTVAALLIILIIILIYIKRRRGKIDIDEVELGLGSQKITLKFDYSDKELAYKIWVEICTRKIGLPFEENEDVIVEVYNSWYKFFEIVREHAKSLPGRRLKNSNNLVELSLDVLNKGIRPHLTKWQAKFRRWYEFELKKEKNTNKTPQDIQRKYPHYNDLIKDIKNTNNKMIVYKNVLYNIIFSK